MFQSMLLKVRADKEKQTEKTGGDAVIAKSVSFNTRKRAVRKFPCTFLTYVKEQPQESYTYRQKCEVTIFELGESAMPKASG